jgi:predicted Zn-dependent protease
MKRTHLLSCLTCAAVLAGCASAPEVAKKVAPPSLISLMRDADIAIKNKHSEQALELLHTAVLLYPGDKSAFVRIAQLHFENERYGDAISSAQRALERDPDDIVAHSLVAVSGLRVSSKALSDLTIKNNLTGTVRAEAQDLAKLLRTSIGGDILIAPARPKAAIVDAIK